ncbi:MAG: hypothetical protein HY941_00510 [Gammaproteobacteria bacterium]|nr:hypothetical protein [Gammaproteobacteria bacterium]
MHILNQRFTAGLVLMLLLSGKALATPAGHDLLFANAKNAATFNETDRRAIYEQLGLKVGPDGKTLVFDGMECPPLQPGSGDIQVQMEDLNSDQRPDIFVSLSSSCMYGMAGIGVSLFIKNDAGHWQAHNLGAGMYEVQTTRHQGYADVMIGGPGFCHPVQRWDGTTYVFDRNVAEQPGSCDGQ